MFDLMYLPDLMTKLGLSHAPIFENWCDLVASQVASRLESTAGANGPAHSQGLDRAHRGDSFDSFSLSTDSPGGISNGLSASSISGAARTDHAAPVVIRWPVVTIAAAAAGQPPAPPRLMSDASAEPGQAEQHCVVSLEAGDLVRAKRLRSELTDLSRSDTLQRLQQMSHRELAVFALGEHLHGRDMSNRCLALKHQLKMKSQSLRRTTSKLQKVAQKHQHQAEPLQVDRYKHKLTWRGAVNLGLRKTMSLVSATSFPLASFVDVSRWTITRAEVLCFAVILARVRGYHDMVYALLKHLRAKRDEMVCGEQLYRDGADLPANSLAPFALPSSIIADELPLPSQDEAVRADHGLPPFDGVIGCMMQCGNERTAPYAMGLTYFSGDATNSSIWQRQKLQGLEASSAVLVDQKALASCNYASAFSTLSCM